MGTLPAGSVTPPIGIRDLHESNRELQLAWAAGRHGADRSIGQAAADAADMVGHLNFIHPARIQVCGQQEIDYFERLDPSRQAHLLQERPRRTGFASSCQAFGHRELFGTLRAFGLVLDPILEYWAAKRHQPENYPAGTWGPPSGVAMLAQDGFVWRRP